MAGDSCMFKSFWPTLKLQTALQQRPLLKKRVTLTCCQPPVTFLFSEEFYCAELCRSLDESRSVELRTVKAVKGQILLEEDERERDHLDKFLRGYFGGKKGKGNGREYLILDRVQTHRRSPLPRPLAECRRRRSPSPRRR